MEIYAVTWLASGRLAAGRLASGRLAGGRLAAGWRPGWRPGLQNFIEYEMLHFWEHNSGYMVTPQVNVSHPTEIIPEQQDLKDARNKHVDLWSEM